jgi:hypothetical protein
MPPGFIFPPLGPTGEGEPVLPPDGNRAYWEGGAYAVTYQCDRPAIAFRCHYPGGSAPCNQETADKFIEWAKAQG